MKFKADRYSFCCSPAQLALHVISSYINEMSRVKRDNLPLLHRVATDSPVVNCRQRPLFSHLSVLGHCPQCSGILPNLSIDLDSCNISQSIFRFDIRWVQVCIVDCCRPTFGLSFLVFVTWPTYGKVAQQNYNIMASGYPVQKSIYNRLPLNFHWRFWLFHSHEICSRFEGGHFLRQ